MFPETITYSRDARAFPNLCLRRRPQAMSQPDTLHKGDTQARLRRERNRQASRQTDAKPNPEQKKKDAGEIKIGKARPHRLVVLTNQEGSEERSRTTGGWRNPPSRPRTLARSYTTRHLYGKMVRPIRAVVHCSVGPAEDQKVEALDAKGTWSY
jgi:hypothetical protein